MQEIGAFVRDERKRQGLTQGELAAKAGVGLNFVYQLENNKTTVQLDKTNLVMRALGYELGALRRFDPWAEQEIVKVTEADSLVAPDQTDYEETA